MAFLCVVPQDMRPACFGCCFCVTPDHVEMGCLRDVIAWRLQGRATRGRTDEGRQSLSLAPRGRREQAGPAEMVVAHEACNRKKAVFLAIWGISVGLSTNGQVEMIGRVETDLSRPPRGLWYLSLSGLDFMITSCCHLSLSNGLGHRMPLKNSVKALKSSGEA